MNCKLKGEEKQRNMKSVQGSNGWGREGEERAAALCHQALVLRMADVSVFAKSGQCVC